MTNYVYLLEATIVDMPREIIDCRSCVIANEAGALSFMKQIISDNKNNYKYIREEQNPDTHEYWAELYDSSFDGDFNMRRQMVLKVSRAKVHGIVSTCVKVRDLMMQEFEGLDLGTDYDLTEEEIVNSLDEVLDSNEFWRDYDEFLDYAVQSVVSKAKSH